MKKILLFLPVVIIVGGLLYIMRPNGESPTTLSEVAAPVVWTRPDGPAKVALQVGHWQLHDVPEELENLRKNTGTSGGGKWEWEVNLDIAQKTANILMQRGVVVDILPATVPPEYWADVFLAIHADGSLDKSVSGFKFAAPRRDMTNNAERLVAELTRTYQQTTKMILDPNVTRNMRGYYAFSWRRYTHAIHPMTTAAIVETGFLTNAMDRQLLVKKPEIPAQALAEGILNYLTAQGLLES